MTDENIIIIDSEDEAPPIIEVEDDDDKYDDIIEPGAASDIHTRERVVAAPLVEPMSTEAISQSTETKTKPAVRPEKIEKNRKRAQEIEKEVEETVAPRKKKLRLSEPDDSELEEEREGDGKDDVDLDETEERDLRIMHRDDKTPRGTIVRSMANKEHNRLMRHPEVRAMLRENFANADFVAAKAYVDTLRNGPIVKDFASRYDYRGLPSRPVGDSDPHNPINELYQSDAEADEEFIKDHPDDSDKLPDDEAVNKELATLNVLLLGDAMHRETLDKDYQHLRVLKEKEKKKKEEENKHHHHHHHHHHKKGHGELDEEDDDDFVEMVEGMGEIIDLGEFDTDSEDDSDLEEIIIV